MGVWEEPGRGCIEVGCLVGFGFLPSPVQGCVPLRHSCDALRFIDADDVGLLVRRMVG